MNPLARLLPALITLLRAPALTWEGADVSVWEHLPGNEAGHYVLVEQPTCTKASGSTACRHWSCTVLLKVITQFPPTAITSMPAEEIASQVTARLECDDTTLPAPRLDLGPGYDCHPAELVLHSELNELDGELVAVQRLLRYRWEIYYSKPSGDAGLAPVRRVQAGRIRAIHPS